ncbi:hypothetical protein [Methylogaea oryzae]|nr:hypothetical protein [Methylogaea oryzae]
MVLGGICLLMALLCWAAILSNRAQHALIDTLGGWKVFMEYREWFHSREDKKP